MRQLLLIGKLLRDSSQNRANYNNWDGLYEIAGNSGNWADSIHWDIRCRIAVGMRKSLLFGVPIR